MSGLGLPTSTQSLIERDIVRQFDVPGLSQSNLGVEVLLLGYQHFKEARISIVEADNGEISRIFIRLRLFLDLHAKEPGLVVANQTVRYIAKCDLYSLLIFQ